MSLLLQVTGRTSLSPATGTPAAVPRRTSARRKNPTVGAVDVLVIVTVVTSSAASSGAATVAARTVTVAGARFRRAVRSAYWRNVAWGLPSDAFQLTTSGWVDSQ